MASKIRKNRNYLSPAEPRYAELNAGHVRSPSSCHQLKVVSYNIKFAQKIDQAIDILATDRHVNDADIILLQEMDPSGVIKIAHALKHNYVYYPAIVHPKHEKDFGNAILSKWPILSDKKIILPYTRADSHQRIAVSSVLKIGSAHIQVFSVHMGIFINASQRKEIIQFLINHVPQDISHCIVAGDFNTFTNTQHHHIHNSFKEADYHLATESVNWTYKHWYLLNRKSNLDHIYAKNLKVVSSGIVNNQSASDHVPVWAVFTFEKQ